MFVYKKLKPSDVSITPFEAHKQYSYGSSSAGTNGITFTTAHWTSESKAHYSEDNLAGNFLNHRDYFQLDKIFYRNYITDNANLIPDVNYIDQERRLYDKTNILSIPQNLFGSRIQPTTFNLTGSFNGGNTIIEIKDDGEGNIYPTSYTLGSTNWPSEKGRLVYIGPVHGFKKKDLTVDNETGNKIVNGSDTFTLENVYDDSYYLNQVDYNKITFIGDTPLTSINTGEEGYLRLDHSELYNFGFEDDFSISFYLDYDPDELYNELYRTTQDSPRYRRVIAKADVKTIVPSPGEGRSEIISTFSSGNLQLVDVPSENKFPFKIELDVRRESSTPLGSGSLRFIRSNGEETVTITDERALYSAGPGTFSTLVHICCQKNGNELSIYRDGIKVASGSDLDPNLCKGIPPTNEANVYVGMKPTLSNDGGDYSKNYGTNFLGYKDDIKLSQLMIWDSALSETQIQNISESITGTPYIGNIFYDEGFVTVNHPSYSDVLQQYSGSYSQNLTLTPTFGDEYNYDEVINVIDNQAWTASITAFNQEQKIWSAGTTYPEISLGENTVIDPGVITYFRVDDYDQRWSGTFNIQKVSSSIFDFNFNSDIASQNPFTVSGSSINFIDKGSYLLLSSSTTTNTQKVTLDITSQSLFDEDFILGTGPGQGVHNNIGETKFDFTSENDGGIADFSFSTQPSTGFLRILGENNQVHKYDGIGDYKTGTQNIGTNFEVITFNSSFAYTPLTFGSGTPLTLGIGGIIADYTNNDIEINPNITQVIHNGTQIYIQAFLTVEPEPDFTQDIDMQLQRNDGSGYYTVSTATFDTNPIVNTTQNILYGPITPQAGTKFRLRARSNQIAGGFGPGIDNATVIGGTSNNPNTFLRAVNQTVAAGFKNFGVIESDTWTTTAEGYYKVIIEGIRTDNDNYGGDPDEPLNKSSDNSDLGVAIQILKNGNAIHTTVIPKDDNYGDFTHDFIETGTGGTYKIKIFITKDNGASNPTPEGFSSDEGFSIGKVTVRGRDKTNTFTVSPALAQVFKTISPGNTNNSNFTFDDVANLTPDNTIIQTISNAPDAGTTITLQNSYTITASIGATASYDEQAFISASTTLSISSSGLYEISNFEIGQDETVGLGSTVLPRLRVSTNRNGNVTNYGPFVGTQNINQSFGILTGSDTIKMDLDAVQNFGSVGNPTYLPVKTGDEVGFSLDNLTIDGLFPTNSIKRLSGNSFPSNLDEIRFFSIHGFDQGNTELPFTTGSVTASVTFMDNDTLQIDSAKSNANTQITPSEMFITGSNPGTGWASLTDNPITGSLTFPAKSKSLYTFKLGTVFGGVLTGSATHIAVQLYEPNGQLVTESLYSKDDDVVASGLSKFNVNSYFTSSTDGNFRLNFFSSDNSFNAVDVSGSDSYISILGDITSSIISGSNIITKITGEDFDPTTVGIAITSSHNDEGEFGGGSGYASFTTGTLDTTMLSYISPTQIEIPITLFITESVGSEATGSVNLGNVYYQYTESVGTTGDIIGPVLEGNFTLNGITYNLLSNTNNTLSITPEILLTDSTDIILNYYTTASHDYEVKFKNSHLIFEHEYQCSVDEEEYNYTQNISVRKNKSNQSADLANCVTGSIDNSQITLFKPYTTTVGLYDDDYNLLAVGKFAQPIRMSEETDMTFVIRWDT